MKAFQTQIMLSFENVRVASDNELLKDFSGDTYEVVSLCTAQG